MRLTRWTVWILLVTPVWSQHTRRSIEAGSIAQMSGRSSRSFSAHARSAVEANATTPDQAPGVIQTNLLDASNIVWLVTAEKLLKGTQISPFIVLPDGSEILLSSISLTDDVLPGASLDLPNIRKFGPFWPQGLLTYGVEINQNGKISQTEADFPVGAARGYDNVSVMVPRIASTFEGLSNRDVILTIGGAFTSDFAYVLVEDLVVPRSAIRLSPSEIAINLSKVPGLDLGVMQDLLLTVGQSGWCDTAVFRHTPGKPGTFNLAPL